MDLEGEPKEQLKDMYYQAKPFTDRAQTLERVKKPYRIRRYLESLELPEDFKKGIQRQYMATWNEVGPSTLSDEAIKERHLNIVDGSVIQFIQKTENNPIYILDPFDRLFNPAHNITKHVECCEWDKD